MGRFKRKFVQSFSAILANSYFKGFSKGTIYQGKLKSVCFPGLNCYSCPGAYTSCPIGSLQSVAAGIKHQISFYVLGFLMLIGTIGGRFVCGWLCPFGLFQELLYKIPVKKIKMGRVFNYGKYFFLVVFVLAAPILLTDDIGLGLPYFCKWICPAGTLEAGIPLAIRNEGIRGAIGLIYYWKIIVLAAVIILSMIISRPFCKAACPSGAIYSLFNKISFYSMDVDMSKCIKCDICQKNCPVDIRIYENPNSPECVRCDKCVGKCPTKAIESGFLNYKRRNRIEKNLDPSCSNDSSTKPIRMR